MSTKASKFFKLPKSITRLWHKISPHIPIVFTCLALIFIAAGSYNRVLDVFELQSYDWRFRIEEHKAKSPDIAIIEIWDDALASIGRWPFDRQYHAALIDILREYDAKMVGMDILFVEPSPSDESLRLAAERYGKVFFCEALTSPYLTDKHIQKSDSVLSELIPEFKAVALGVGHVNATIDIDGSRRRVAPLITAPGKQYLHLGTQMALRYMGIDPKAARIGNNGNVVLPGGKYIPLDKDGQFLVRFSAPWKKAFTHISYYEILAAYKAKLMGKKARFDLSSLKDKVCFVGLTATATHDINPVPIDPLYPQVGMHADVFRNVVEQNFVRRLSPFINLIILGLLIGLATWVSRSPNLTRSVLSAAVIIAIYAVMVLGAFKFFKLWIDIIYPCSMYLVVYLTSILKRTMSEKKKRELMEAELSIASKIQRSFLPENFPVSNCVDIAAYMLPAKHVGGDLYDAFVLSDGKLGLMCGDVSGKGIPAALFMSRCVAAFKFAAAGQDDPAIVLTRFNENLSESDGSGLFVTMSYVIIDEANQKFVFSSGGHNELIRVRKDGSSDLLDPEGGMPIGLMQGIEFGNLSLDIEPGDIFVMYSDGISEARNPRKEDYDMQRFQDAIIHAKDLSAEKIKDYIIKNVNEFVNGANQHDDMTVMVIKAKEPETSV
ncbi:MAG: CHASE2 domain-containing sensor protein [Candidatus Omnitrophota bacterium]